MDLHRIPCQTVKKPHFAVLVDQGFAWYSCSTTTYSILLPKIDHTARRIPGILVALRLTKRQQLEIWRTKQSRLEFVGFELKHWRTSSACLCVGNQGISKFHIKPHPSMINTSTAKCCSYNLRSFRKRQFPGFGSVASRQFPHHFLLDILGILSEKKCTSSLPGMSLTFPFLEILGGLKKVSRFSPSSQRPPGILQKSLPWAIDHVTYNGRHSDPNPEIFQQCFHI